VQGRRCGDCGKRGNLPEMRGSRRGWQLISAVVLTAALSAVAAAPVTGASDAQEVTLAKYLSSASWPVRAASLRVNTVSDRIDFLFAYGDSPVLGGIAGACRNVMAVNNDTRGTLARLRAPAPLQTAQLRLWRAYSKVESGCKEARALALRARDAGDRLARAIRKQVPDRQAAFDLILRETGKMPEMQRLRQYLRQFAPTLRSFSQTVARWRSAVLAYSSTLRVPPPVWVTQLC
jgi:hypothetical protein